MRKLTYILLMMFAFMAASDLHAQAMKNEGSHVVDAKLLMQGIEINNDYVFINYEIPYSGMVEIRLYDGSGQMVWRNQYDRTYGKNRIVLKASKFVPGEKYAYVLNYKRDMVRDELVIPGTPN